MGLKTILGLKKPSIIESDGLYMRGRTKAPLKEPRFIAAWEAAVHGNREGWAHKSRGVPDIRLRALTCITAAKQALLVDGHFVECGVHTGLLSMAVCHYLNFDKLDRTFFLFDTFGGIPTDGLSGVELKSAEKINGKMYFDCYDIAKRNFSSWQNAKLVRGMLPDTLDVLGNDWISYLSIDLNAAVYEMQVIKKLWDQISPGGVIVLDDYGWAGRSEQFNAWNDFCGLKNVPIFFLATGQGLIFKPM